MDVCRIGVVIPAYNAENTIRGVIEGLVDFGIEPANIIVVDDGSRDKTAQISARCGACVVTHTGNRGKGAALRTGIKALHAKSVPGVFFIDADGQHLVSEIKGFLPKISTYELVIGWRRKDIAMPLLRRAVNRMTSLVISLLAHTLIPDVQCGFRFVSLKIFDTISLSTHHYETESEIVVKAVRSGYRIAFVPVTAIYDNQRSYIKPIADTLRFIYMTLGFLWA